MKRNKPRKRYRIAYTFVIADLFHFGHLQLLKTAKKNADYHICGLISDEAAHLWQGNNITNYEERKAVLEGLGCVDKLMKQETMDPTDNLKAIKGKYPDAQIIVVHGDDWKTIPAREYIESIGGKIIQPEYYSQLSRETIIKKFKQIVTGHPLKHEYFTRHFRVGNIVQFNSQAIGGLISTKADTLKRFQPILKSCKIEKLFICTVNDFEKYQQKVVKSIQKQFDRKKIIIRSSTSNEDCYSASNAGCYISMNNVNSAKNEEIVRGIKNVIKSYKKNSGTRNNNQIFIQKQVEDIKKSGVVFTRNLHTNTPYYLINYDDQTGKTDTVTGGQIGKSLWVYRGADFTDYPPQWQKLLKSIQEIESHLPGMVLDIEFAEKNDGTIIIFQIRPLAANIKYREFDDEKFSCLNESQLKKYKGIAKKNVSHKPFYSDMAFWNPAEIIGDNPHPLDYSVYREIITKRAWNDGLTRLGYTPVKNELMERFGNKPYIDLDYAFRSLTVNSINKKLRRKLIDYYKSKLKEDLSAHDKIEFEIVLSCYDFDLKHKFDEMHQNGFSKEEIKVINNTLKHFTLSIIKGYKNRLKHDMADLELLSLKTKVLFENSSNSKNPFALIGNCLKLLHYISTYGTPQFATIAREAFIAEALCKSMASSSFFAQVEIDNFLKNISTVASGFDRDFQEFACGNMNQKEFLNKYGHLRAGTYDITSPRYDRMEFEKLPHKHKPHSSFKKKKTPNVLSKPKLKRALRESGLLEVTTEEFLSFLRSSIKQREYFKFEFTKSLSLALELLAKAGELLGFSKNELAYLDIPKIKSFKFYTNPKELSDFWSLSIEAMKTVYSDNSKLILPPIIQDEKSFLIIDTCVSRPNFITDQHIEGNVVNLDVDQTKDLNGKIVLITRADPGFDWIFTQNIKGLITKYGGAASHMAIRCAEFNLPAAIGCGEQIYNKISTCNKLRLDANKKKILPIY